MDVLLALQDVPLVQSLRLSRWAYAMVNIGHVFGLALLFGAIVPLDLRRLGLARRLDERALARLLVPVAAAGLLLALATGALLFSVRAAAYAESPLFLTKIGLIALACAAIAASALSRTPAMARVTALLSIVMWTGVILCGRLLGYWEG
jgi:hypothetical protein